MVLNTTGVTFGSEDGRSNAESVRKCEPRVALWQPWEQRIPLFLKLFTQGFKANPGLKLANAFSVIFINNKTTETQRTRRSHREIEFKALPDPGVPRYDHRSGHAPPGTPVRALPEAILFHAFSVKTRRQVEIRMSCCPEVRLCFQSGTRCNTIPAH